MDPMSRHFSIINGLESFKRIQFSLCGPANLIFAHSAVPPTNMPYVYGQSGIFGNTVCVDS